MKLSKKAAAVISVAAAMVAGTALPAAAAQENCYAGGYWSITKKCTTPSLKANRNHDIRVRVYACKGAPYRVVDVNTKRTVASGTGKGQNVEINRVINGLYGHYQAKLTDSCYRDFVVLEDS